MKFYVSVSVPESHEKTKKQDSLGLPSVWFIDAISIVSEQHWSSVAEWNKMSSSARTDNNFP